MKLALLGATGFVGAGVLRTALGAGLQVTVLVRDPGGLAHREGLEVVEGDARDRAAVDRAVAGAQAVISVLGTRRGEKTGTDELAQMMRNILAAMEHHGVRRLVAISGAGIVVPGERKPFPHNLISGLVRILARRAVDAKQREYEVLSRSDLDWTAVRATRVVEGPATGRVRVGTDAGSIGMRVTRGDLAAFLVSLVWEGGYVREAPFISSG
jgi:putative NADH-flavin reductase